MGKNSERVEYGAFTDSTFIFGVGITLGFSTYLSASLPDFGSDYIRQSVKLGYSTFSRPPIKWSDATAYKSEDVRYDAVTVGYQLRFPPLYPLGKWWANFNILSSAIDVDLDIRAGSKMPNDTLPISPVFGIEVDLVDFRFSPMSFSIGLSTIMRCDPVQGWCDFLITQKVNKRF
jgi:hypothetical protein